ncbi:MAG: hypothetical protein AB1553_02020 [Nitrospirota bacterium]
MTTDPVRILTFKEWLQQAPEKGKKCHHDGQHCIRRNEPACFQCYEHYRIGCMPGRKGKQC